MKISKPILTTNKTTPRLTVREKECLLWAARGKSSEETALILNLKISTVNYYRKKIKEKLDCINMAQAVYEGIKQNQFF